LAGAIALIVMAESLPEGQMSPAQELSLWVLCLLLTGLALGLALADARRLRQQIRDAHRNLILGVLRGAPEANDAGRMALDHAAATDATRGARTADSEKER
jgi:hypothetical protein